MQYERVPSSESFEERALLKEEEEVSTQEKRRTICARIDSLVIVTVLAVLATFANLAFLSTRIGARNNHSDINYLPQPNTYIGLDTLTRNSSSYGWPRTTYGSPRLIYTEGKEGLKRTSLQGEHVIAWNSVSSRLSRKTV